MGANRYGNEAGVNRYNVVAEPGGFRKAWVYYEIYQDAGMWKRLCVY